MARRNNNNCWQPGEYRKELSELAETFLGSIADVTSDWLFFNAVINDETFQSNSMYDILIIALFCVCAASTIFAIVVLVSSVMVLLGRMSASTFNIILAAEALVADVPDFVVTYLVEAARGDGISEFGVLTLATSAYNIVQDTLLACRLEDMTTVTRRRRSGDEEEGRYADLKAQHHEKLRKVKAKYKEKLRRAQTEKYNGYDSDEGSM
mmetsp:Transcript_4328/g.6746  ORF Transcript_4328/g.6746 Transcript_4328/m.6746 type:complete len:209 (-) Transcript_4328:118-744(-)